jgi:hypothetical protein
MMADHVHHPDRVNYPLKRKAGRGAGPRRARAQSTASCLAR